MDQQTFELDQFVRWTNSDVNGEFSHVGQVHQMTDEMITLKTEHGLIHLPKNDGKFIPTNKPIGWELPETKTKDKAKVQRTTTKKASSKAPKEKKERGPSKVDIIVEMFKDNMPASRKEAIAKIVEAGITTPAGASTFWNTAKKKLNK